MTATKIFNLSHST